MYISPCGATCMEKSGPRRRIGDHLLNVREKSKARSRFFGQSVFVDNLAIALEYLRRSSMIGNGESDSFFTLDPFSGRL